MKNSKTKKKPVVGTTNQVKKKARDTKCMYFGIGGGCINGEECKYSHSMESLMKVFALFIYITAINIYITAMNIFIYIYIMKDITTEGEDLNIKEMKEEEKVDGVVMEVDDMDDLTSNMKKMDFKKISFGRKSRR